MSKLKLYFVNNDMSAIKSKLNSITEPTKDNYQSCTIQGLNERVKKLEKKIAKLETLIKVK